MIKNLPQLNKTEFQIRPAEGNLRFFGLMRHSMKGSSLAPPGTHLLAVLQDAFLGANAALGA